MRPSIRTVRTPTRGFTLVELMISVAVMGIVMLAIYGAFFKTQRAADSVTGVVTDRQSARAAVQLLEREIRMAGSGWGRSVVVGTSNGAGHIDLNPVNFGYGGPDANDTLSIVGGWEASTMLANGMPNASAVLKVNDTSGFADGDLLVITDGTTADMFEVTQVNSQSLIIQHNPSSPFNDPGGHSTWPGTGYNTGAQVYKVTWVAYKVDSTSYRKPALIRAQVGRAPQIAAYDVSGFRVYYQMQDGSLTRNPASLNFVARVLPVVYTRALSPNRVALNDSVWASIRPRTF